MNYMHIVLNSLTQINTLLGVIDIHFFYYTIEYHMYPCKCILAGEQSSIM